MPHADPVLAQAYNRAYKQANRWRYRRRQKVYDAAKHANMRAAAASSPGTLTPNDIELLFQNSECSWCHQFVEFFRRTVDHRVALTRGGANTPPNILMACGSCNASKHAGVRPFQWARLYAACVECQSTARRHLARGMCTACYQRIRKLASNERIAEVLR